MQILVLSIPMRQQKGAHIIDGLILSFWMMHIFSASLKIYLKREE